MIRLSSVTKAFGEKVVLDEVSLEIATGEIVFCIGKSGAGKSVLLKHIVGLLPPESGMIWVDEQEITQANEAELFEVRRRCGMVFQFPALLDQLDVFENVAFGLRAHGVHAAGSPGESAAVKRALAAVHLGDHVAKLYPSELSVGQAKRASIARAIALEPRHLLFDEPTTGLDPVAMGAVNRLIRDLSRRLGVSAVVVSHDMQCAIDIADRIILLDGGKIVAEGSPEKLLQSEHPVARAFLEEARERTRT